jgi:hypothetical protein
VISSDGLLMWPRCVVAPIIEPNRRSPAYPARRLKIPPLAGSPLIGVPNPVRGGYPRSAGPSYFEVNGATP